jgi:hypothetical protein
MHGVTQLVDESLVIDSPLRENWFLNITKQNTNVEISLIISIRYILAIDFLVVYPISPFALFFITFLYALFRQYKLNRDCGVQIGRKLWDWKQGPILITGLIVIGAALLTPFISGTINEDFEIVEHEERTEQHFSHSINESVDTIRLDLIEGDLFGFEIHSFAPENTSIGLMLYRSENTHQLGLVNLSDAIYWSLDIECVNDTMLAIEVVRIDDDVDFEISLERIRIWLGPKVDIIMPIILACCGCVLLVCGFVVTRRIHYLLKQEVVERLEQ